MIKKIILKNKEEWLKNRKLIGGSDASCVLGLNPYKSNVDLWLEKTGQKMAEDISQKTYVKYGTQAESSLRRLFKLDFPDLKVRYNANNIFFNEKFPFAHASLDGELVDKKGRKGILEIKTTNILQSMQKEKWKDRIPDNYYIQILHYLMVTEYEFAILKAQLKSEFNESVYIQIRHYRIEREDVESDIEYLERKEREFWQCVKEKKQPHLILPEL